ncbi:hypothetical protein FRC20_008693, partial [Serendipita sp. 405]
MPPSKPSESDLVIDQSKIGTDGSDIYLFQFLSGAVCALKTLPIDEIKPQIPTFESTLISIALSSPPFTTPAGRPIRSLVARSMILVFGRGESKGLFDTVNKLLISAGDPKERDAVRISAFYCIGELMGNYGSQVMSFMVELSILAIKVYRSTSGNPLLRYHALLALSRAISSTGRALTDQAVKDVHKNMRSALLDKALSVQRAAASVLIGLYPNTVVPPPSGSGPAPSTAMLSHVEMESLIAQAIKSFDDSEIDTSTRLSLANLVGHLLSSSQVPRPVAPSTSKAATTSTSTQSQDDSLSVGAKVQQEIIAKPLLSPREMLVSLGTWMNKQATTRKQR